MPQRLLQTPSSAGFPLEVNGRKLASAHAQIAGVLRSRLGQGHGDLLATPQIEADGAITWTTALTGEVIAATALPDEDRARLEQRTQRLLGDIRGLGQQLKAEGPAAQMVGQMVERAAQLPAGDWLFSVGGKPVLALWGHSDSPVAAAPPAVAPVAAATVSPAAAAPAAPDAAMAAAMATVGEPAAVSAAGLGAPPPPPSPPPPNSSNGKRWLAWAALLLIALALLFFGLKRCSDAPPPGGDDLSAKLGEAEARNKALEDEIAKRKALKPQYQCVPEPAAPAASAPEPVASAPEPAASQPEPAASQPLPAASQPEPAASQPEAPASRPEPAKPDPYAALKRKVDAAGKDCNTMQALLSKEPLLKGADPKAAAIKKELVQSLAQNCKEKLIKEAKNMCPGQRPKELAPELALVFDASGSMRWSANLNDEQVRRSATATDLVQEALRAFGGINIPRGGGGADRSALMREPTRITAAREAATQMVRRAPSDANISLVRVEGQCSARVSGSFPPSRRGALLSELQGLQPNGGTPLADGIAKGGQLVDGVTREALMVVISDGAESCGQDPCAVARQLKRAKPYLKINVVDITGTGAGNCVAQATGGRVFTARNADDVASMTRQAAQEAMGPANCPSR